MFHALSYPPIWWNFSAVSAILFVQILLSFSQNSAFCFNRFLQLLIACINWCCHKIIKRKSPSLPFPKKMYLSRNMKKNNKMTVCPAKTQISLGIRPVWSESSLCTQWVAKDQRFLHANSEDSDQTWRMPRLIWVFAGRTLILLVLSCRSSFDSLR